jgi:predicted MPP superfamily phosphohydrolase
VFLVQDVLVPSIIVFAQILIGRLFFRQWKKLLPPLLASLFQVALYLLWAAVALGTLLRFPPITWALRWTPAPLRSALSAFGNVWGMASLGSLAMYYAWRFLTRNPAVKHSPDRRRLIHAAGLAAAAAPFAVAGFGAIVERTNFQIREIDLPVPGLHPDLEGLRIGQLSDLHVSPWLSVQELGRAVDMLNELKPHLTVVTGDLITQVGDPLDDTIRELSRLRADAGILGCLGNHEMYAQCQNYTARNALPYGIAFLRNEARLLRFGNGVLNVAGVDYQKSQRIHPYLQDAEKLVVPGASNLLLSHNPDVFPAAVRKGYDAVLSGHTHGGQVTVEIVNQTLNAARFFTPYVAGLYRLEGRSCYVTAGIGTITVPVRIGALPEITLARLRSA